MTARDVSTELQTHRLHREQIEALLTSRPLETVEPDELRKISPHYQQRISESRRHGLRIENVPRWLELTDGTKKRLDGGYRFYPYAKLGRDGAELVPREWTNDGPYQEPFRLKP